MRNLFLLLFVICISSFVYSQEKTDFDANTIIQNRGEIYFSFKVQPEEFYFFREIVTIEGYNGKIAHAYANMAQFEKFLDTGKEFEVYKEYYQTKALTMATTVAEMINWDRYPTYEVYVEMMQSFAADYPDICILDTIGYTGDGRMLLVVKISDNVATDEAEPEFLYTGMMHGDELIGGMVFLRLVDHILQNYGTDEQITNLVNDVQIYINPFANPDGTYYGGNNTVADSRRANAADIDLNRNYKDFIAGDHPDGNDYGVETVIFMDYAAERNFVMSANTHSGAELLNYPYDTQSILPSDDDWWQFVCWEYADTVHEYAATGYLTDQGNGVTNGYAWYTITGSRQDYMNYYAHCREVTLELSTTKLLDAEDLPDYWEYNRRSLLNYMEQVTYGLRGTVTDSITHEPLEAMVYIDGFDTFNSHVFSFPTYGDYYRLLNEGDYSVTFSCDGYRSKTIDVSIENYQQTLLDVELANLDMLPPDVNFEANAIITDCNPVFSFENTSEASESTTYLWDFGDGSNSTDESPTHSYVQNGEYTVKLYGENAYGEDSIIKEQYISVSLTELNDISDYAICETAGSVTIDPDLSGEVHWFENLNDGSSFYIGTTYTTPTLSENTTYYVQEVTVGDGYNGGESDNSEGGDYVSDNNYLVFDCTQECVLETVKVYAQNAGTRTIYLKTSGGVDIYSEDIYIDAGEQIVTLNFNIPVGESMKLGCANPNGLFRGSTGIWSTFPYPYDIGGVVTINESNVVWWNDSDRYYAYFYDWNIKLQDCYSERTPVSVYINQAPAAAFESSSVGASVEFTNTSTAAETFVWDFGDESTSSLVNPTHVYSEPGTYTVSLTATSECGSDISTQEVLVTAGIDDEITNNLNIYPNPVNDILTISSDEEIDQIRIIDITGRLVDIQVPKSVDRGEYQIDFSSYVSGTYLLEISTNEKIKVTKIIKN